MKYNIRVAEPAADRSKWQTYVENNPDSTIYHKWVWREIVEDVFKKKTYYLIAENESKISGVLPLVYFNSVLFGKFLVSYPYVNYGGILAENEDVQNDLIDYASNLAKE